jgi:hypothetical protein
MVIEATGDRAMTEVVPGSDPDGQTIREGMREVLWPGQAERERGEGTVSTRQEYEDVTIDDLRLRSPQNPDDRITEIRGTIRPTSIHQVC